jgi:hypothetical protein
MWHGGEKGLLAAAWARQTKTEQRIVSSHA